MTGTSRPIVQRALSDEGDHHGVDAPATVMVRNRASGYGDYDATMTMLAELRSGISEGDD